MKKENTGSQEDQKIICKAQNKLVSAHFHYTQCQMDILFYLLSIAKDNEKEYTFPIRNIMNLTGREWNPVTLKNSTEKLMQNIISYEDEATPNDKWVHISLFQEIEYGDGNLHVTLNEKAIPLFNQTKQEFTYMELKYGLLLNSKYSKRLYWLLCQWRQKGSVHYFIDELKELLDIGCNKDGLSKYRNSDFKVMIDKTVSEINQITDMTVSVRWNKTIRTISSATFLIDTPKYLPSTESDINYNIPLEKGEALHYFKQYPISENQALEMYDKGCRIDDLKKIIKKITETATKKNASGEAVIENYEAYLIECIQNAGFLSKKGTSQRTHRTKEEKDRQKAIDLIKNALAEGYPKEMFKATIEKYKIEDSEIMG